MSDCPTGPTNFDSTDISYTEQKKERYIKFSLELCIFHSNIVTECIDIYNYTCFKVYMT